MRHLAEETAVCVTTTAMHDTATVFRCGQLFAMYDKSSLVDADDASDDWLHAILAR